MSRSAIATELRVQVAKRDQGRCQYCHLRQFGQSATFHIDHVQPRSRGGATAPDNLVLQCPYCSLHKSDKVAGIDADSGQSIALFHPLQQNWVDHFRVDDDGTLVGLTATGRVTISELHMNDPLPRTARALQILLGLG